MVAWYVSRDSGQTEDDSRVYTVRDTEGMIDKMLANARYGAVITSEGFEDHDI